MTRRFCMAAMLIVFSLAASFGAARAQWVKDGIPVCTADYYQTVPVSCPADSGGAIYVWQDMRNGYDIDIYATKVFPNGQSVMEGSIPICTAPNWQGSQQVIPDGTGGGIVVWCDDRDGSRAIYAQWVDGTGTARWTENGIPLCEAVSQKEEPRLVMDGVGGVIVVWSDYRGGTWDIYGQRIDPSGNLLWGPDGISVCDYESDQYNAVIVSDGAGSVTIGWVDQRSYDGGDIFAQRIDTTGTQLWNPDGVSVCAAPSTQQQVRIAASPAGGALFMWNDYRNGNSACYAEWIDSNGLSGWGTPDGIPVCTAGWNVYGAAAAGDGMGGLYVAWYDERDNWNYPIYAQHIDATGSLLWGDYGTLSVWSYSYNSDLVMRADGFGGAVLAGDLYPTEASNNADIVAQKLGPGGATMWGPQGVVACGESSDQYFPTVAPDGMGGAYIGWEDNRSGGNTDIYCQRISASGLWGNPEPEIVYCADVPQDQGGWVRIRTRASSHDASGGIVGYNVWRLIGAGGGPIMSLSEALPRLLDPARASGVRIDASQAAALGLPEGDWESVGFWFATRDTIYNIAVPTKNDSTEAGTAWETFLVTAHSATPGSFAPSQPVDGYSIDNLAPGATPELAGNESADPAGLTLTWGTNPAPDMWKYNVHRGTDELFVPDGSSLVGSTEGLALFDATWQRSYHYFYKLVAVDRHGNCGPAVLLRPEDINVGMMLQSFAASLRGSYVEIAWTVAPTDEGFSFDVLRAVEDGDYLVMASAGIVRENLSFTFVDRLVEPGTTYRYRVEVTDSDGRRVLFETDAVSTPAMPLALHQNHPNPFNPSTTIAYYLPEAAVVRLDVYSADGSLVRRLVDGEREAKGTHSVQWDGLDGRGGAVSSGVYFYRLQTGKEKISRKMVLMR